MSSIIAFAAQKGCKSEDLQDAKRYILRHRCDLISYLINDSSPDMQHDPASCLRYLINYLLVNDHYTCVEEMFAALDMNRDYYRSLTNGKCRPSYKDVHTLIRMHSVNPNEIFE